MAAGEVPRGDGPHGPKHAAPLEPVAETPMPQSQASGAAADAGSLLAGRLWMVAATLLWSSNGLFSKAPLFDDWPAAERGPLLAFWRALFAGLVLVWVIRRPRWRAGLVPLTAFFTAMNVMYLSAITLTTAANAIWLQSTAPGWVLVLGVLVFREPFVRRDLIALAFAGLGVGLILAFEIRGQQLDGVMLGLASGVAYACVVLLLRMLRDEDPAWLVALCHLVAAAVLLPWLLMVGRFPSPTQLVVLAAFGTFQMAIPYLCLHRALRTIRSQEAVVIGLAEPILLPLWVWLAWGEQPAVWTLAGAGLIALGLLLRYVVFAERTAATAA